MAAKKQALPAILIANDLLDGTVVVRTGDGWSHDPRQALVATDDGAAALLAEQAAHAMARHEVVDAYLVDVTVDADGLATPNHFRERIKVKGPSHRPELGKQAGLKI
jgi:hypothetical protein